MRNIIHIQADEERVATQDGCCKQVHLDWSCYGKFQMEVLIICLCLLQPFVQLRKIDGMRRLQKAI